MSFMFQGMCAEAGVLHKKKRREKKKREKNDCRSLNRHNIFFSTQIQTNPSKLLATITRANHENISDATTCILIRYQSFL
jgi:hypothetical protein